MQHDLERSVAGHYGRHGLLDSILQGVEAAGGDPAAPAPEQLAPVDEFHTAGRVTTIRALELMPLATGMHVLDAGCGIGGTARYLARERGCRVTGLDLTPEFIEVAEELTSRMKLDDACEFHTGSVLSMPFADDSFDAAVTFHVAMNIDDRAGFYGELARVLRPDASLCVFDVMKGPAPGMNYPVPWAETPETSFLKTPEETRKLLAEAGFRVVEERSERSFAIDYFRKIFAAMAEAGGPPPLGLHLLMGQNAPDKFKNYVQGLESAQIDPVIMVARRL